MSKVNLDALIPREDFEVTGNANNAGNLFHSISIGSFQPSAFFYPFLRKPDFQRETNEWDSKKVAAFLESFINGDLIPSIILWRSNSGLFFIIDGAHRLSTLIAWINNDYGDGPISSKLFDNNIPDDQKKIAEETRKLVDKQIGSYQALIAAASDPNSNLDLIHKARNVGAYSIQVQWVEGDAKKAEHSFFKINQQGEPLNSTEIKLLQSRKKPNCIAARAIIRAGKGHKYWSAFSAENQNRIQDLAKEINSILFDPALQTPIKTADIPIGGKLMSALTLPLILDMVNIVNGIPIDFKKTVHDDVNGEETIRILAKVRKITWRMNSMHASSLGLHPLVYFYSQEGKHKPASFYAILAFVMELEVRDMMNDFIKIRSEFEDFLITYDYIIQQINRKYRSSLASYQYIKEFYFDALRLFISGKSALNLIAELVTYKHYQYISLTAQESAEIQTPDFSSDRKSKIFIIEALKSSVKCAICDGFIHRNAISIDHIQRVQDGGLGVTSNGQISHPYCNTTFKN